jgi:antitoxin Phd
VSGPFIRVAATVSSAKCDWQRSRSINGHAEQIPAIHAILCHRIDEDVDMSIWQLSDAKAKLGKVIDLAMENGPQIVTRRGVETAVILSIDQWKHLLANQRPEVKQDERTEQQRRDDFLALLRSAPGFEIPDRHRERLERRKAYKQQVAAAIEAVRQISQYGG